MVHKTLLYVSQASSLVVLTHNKRKYGVEFIQKGKALNSFDSIEDGEGQVSYYRISAKCTRDGFMRNDLLMHACSLTRQSTERVCRMRRVRSCRAISNNTTYCSDCRLTPYCGARQFHLNILILFHFVSYHHFAITFFSTRIRLLVTWVVRDRERKK